MLMESKLSPEIITDDINYFFTMLSDRFEPLNARWQQALQRRFGVPFKPIHVLPFKHNSYFEEENYLVFNAQLEELQAKEGRQDIINLIYPEDLNRQFSESALVAGLIEKLLAKQDKVYVVGFTTVWLDMTNPDVVVLGPDTKLAGRLDNKVEHLRVFRELDLEINQASVYETFSELRDQQTEYPCFVSASYSSGGIESAIVQSLEELDRYYDGLRGVNQRQPFIVSRFLDNIVQTPNTSAIITGPNQTTITCISDQLLRGHRYMGNIYPSQASTDVVAKISDMTIKVGNYLSTQGFRGMFGIDFLVTDDNKCYPVDLNPRHQGGYYCNVMASATDLINIEMSVALGEDISAISYDDFQVDYVWAHSKLTPFSPNSRILQKIKVGEPAGPFNEVGSSYTAQYYPINHTLVVGNPGFYMTTGADYQEVAARLAKETNEIIKASYESDII